MRRGARCERPTHLGRSERGVGIIVEKKQKKIMMFVMTIMMMMSPVTVVTATIQWATSRSICRNLVTIMSGVGELQAHVKGSGWTFHPRPKTAGRSNLDTAHFVGR